MVDAFIRDESSKNRYDPAVTGVCFAFMMELFDRVLKSELGVRVEGNHGAGGEKGC